MAILVIQTGKHAGRQVKLPNHTVVIGRDEGCFLKLSGSDVSRKHCELKPVGGSWVVTDLASQNGTFVNGEKITGATRLTRGDDLLVGHMHFQWEGPKKPVDTASVLEDSISDWLTERDTALAPAPGQGTGDTTILTADEVTHKKDGVETTSAVSTLTPPGGSGLLTSGSATPPAAHSERRLPLAEEARAVIRKFVEEVGDGKPPALGQD
jgi:predicted component of type VI protein secretion system